HASAEEDQQGDGRAVVGERLKLPVRLVMGVPSWSNVLNQSSSTVVYSLTPDSPSSRMGSIRRSPSIKLATVMVMVAVLQACSANLLKVNKMTRSMLSV